MNWLPTLMIAFITFSMHLLILAWLIGLLKLLATPFWKLPSLKKRITPRICKWTGMALVLLPATSSWSRSTNRNAKWGVSLKLAVFEFNNWFYKLILKIGLKSTLTLTIPLSGTVHMVVLPYSLPCRRTLSDFVIEFYIYMILRSLQNLIVSERKIVWMLRPLV